MHLPVLPSALLNAINGSPPDGERPKFDSTIVWKNTGRRRDETLFDIAARCDRRTHRGACGRLIVEAPGGANRLYLGRVKKVEACKNIRQEKPIRKATRRPIIGFTGVRSGHHDCRGCRQICSRRHPSCRNEFACS
jgi:hypothetical protein